MLWLYESILIIIYMLYPTLGFILSLLLYIFFLFQKENTFEEKIINCLIVSSPFYAISIIGYKLPHIISFTYIFLLVLILYIVLNIIRRKYPFPKKTCYISIVVLILLIIGSVFFEEKKIEGLFRVFQTLTILIPPLLVYEEKEHIAKNVRHFQIEKFLELIDNSIIAVSISIVIQYILFHYFGNSIGVIYQYPNRIIFNSIFSAASIITVFLGNGVILNYKRLLDKVSIGKILKIALYLLAILLNTSRTGIAGIFIVCTMITIESFIKEKKFRNKKFILSIVFILILIIYVFIFSFYGRKELNNIFSLNGRLFTYSYGISKIFSSAKSFLIGNGLVITNYSDGQLPHNFILETLLEMGIINLIIMLILLYKLLKYLNKSRCKYIIWNILICCMFITGFHSIPLYTIYIVLSIICETTERMNSHSEKKIKIKVLEYVPAYNVGGIESLVYQIFKSKGEDIEFDLMVEVDLNKQIQNKISKMNINIIRIPNLTKESFVKHIFYVKKIIKNNNYDVVHSHEIPLRFWILKYAKKYGVKNRILHSHSVDFESSKYSFVRKITSKISIKYANELIACSSEAGQVFGNKKYKVLTNGIDPIKYKFSIQKRNIIRKKLMLVSSDILLIQVGRLTEIKNHKFSIELLSLLDDKYKFVIVGDGPNLKELRNICKLYNVENRVIFTGNVENVNDYLSASDVYIMPSISEGFSLVALESQANGICTLLSDGIPKFVKITNFTQLLPLDLKIWKDTILNLKFNNFELRKNAYKNIVNTQFSINQFVNEIYNIYYKS